MCTCTDIHQALCGPFWQKYAPFQQPLPSFVLYERTSLCPEVCRLAGASALESFALCLMWEYLAQSRTTLASFIKEALQFLGNVNTASMYEKYMSEVAKGTVLIAHPLFLTAC